MIAKNPKVIMTAQQFVDRAKSLASRDSFYKNKYPYNLCYVNNDRRLSADCLNLYKAILNGYDVNNGTIGYFQKDLKNTGDCTEAELIAQCTDVSQIFSDLREGVPEILYMKGHIGAYIGEEVMRDGHLYNVIECTGSWERCILYSYVDTSGRRLRYRNGKQNGKWTHHGKMTKWVDYSNTPIWQPVQKPKQTEESEEYNMPTIKRGSKGKAVMIWQIILGNVVVDGDFGPATEASSRKWQSQNGLVSDGIIGRLTWKAGLNSVK